MKRKRKMRKEQIEGVITDLTRFRGTVDFTYEGIRTLLLDALHDLRLADVEIERLRELTAWRRAAIEMLIDCAKNHAPDCECPLKAQAALEDAS